MAATEIRKTEPVVVIESIETKVKSRTIAAVKKADTEEDQRRDRELAALFEKHEVKKKRPAKVLKVNMRVCRPVDKKDTMRIVQLRYGSLEDYSTIVRTYSQIGRETRTPHQTVRSVLIRFHERGNVYDKLHRLRPKSTHLWKITPEMRSQIFSHEFLDKWKVRSMRWRADEIFRLFGVRVHQSHLRRLYRAAGIRYSSATKQYYQKESEEELFQIRKLFARRLAKLIEKEEKYLIYMDECSFNMWELPRRTWHKKG